MERRLRQPHMGGPVAACPEADWLRGVARHAGFVVQGDTGSTLILERRGNRFFAWTTEGPSAPARPGRLRGGTGRVSWRVPRLTVWVEPYRRALLPRPELRRLVRVTLDVLAPAS